MKAEELMIGDFVNFVNYPLRVTQPLGDYGRVVLTERTFPKDMRGEYEFDEYLLDPIPITPEILEKNGGMIGDSDVYYLNDTFGVIEIYYNEDSKKWDLDVLLDERFNKRIHIDIEYVHELQHALKLCGIKKEIRL